MARPAKRERLVMPDKPCRKCGGIEFRPKYGDNSSGRTCVACHNATNRAYMARNGTDQRLRARYGISEERRDKMLADQGGCCALCGSDDPASQKGWSVDHCHDSGKVRAILCQTCNKALGFFGADPERFEEAARYLRKHREEV